MSVSTQTQFSTTWRCPSNIALVKYWGKYGNQLPCNSSISLTLSNSYTEVTLELTQKATQDTVELAYFFEGKPNEKFEKRVKQFIENNQNYFADLMNYGIRIQSHNSFPHSAGIASSASAFGAISLALLEASYRLNQQELDAEFYEKASELARLGSGSASRSMFASYAMWGENEKVPHSTNQKAIQVNQIHPQFQSFCDTILIVEDEPKKVSSSVGHALMNNHPYAANRFEQANQRTAQMIEILKQGEMDAFIQITESEALTLHAMMMTSGDYYLLMKPGTIEIIEKVFEFRNATNLPVCFTLDAGPNIHLLYPESIETEVHQFIQTTLKPHFKSLIHDKIGNGPVCLSLVCS